MLWNPFDHLVESKKHKFARIIRSSLGLRLFDTFCVFFGGITEEKEMGILDYIFPPARLSFMIFSWADRPNLRKSNSALVHTSFISTLIFNFIKLVTAAVLTVALSPLISLIHLCIKPFQNRMVNRIRNITIHPVSSVTSDVHSPKFETKIKLRELDEKCFENYIIQPLPNYPKFEHRFFFGSYYPSEAIIYLGVYKAEYSPTLRNLQGPYSTASSDRLSAVIEINNNNWQGILALLKTNTMFSTKNLENNLLFKTEDAHEVIEKQILPYLAKKAFIAGMSRSPRNNSSIKKFVESPIYDPKVTSLIFQYAGFPQQNRLLDPVKFAEEKRNTYQLRQ